MKVVSIIKGPTYWDYAPKCYVLVCTSPFDGMVMLWRWPGLKILP